MNIRGQTQYSNTVAGIRQPSKFQDQDFKLVFVYPMLLADKISNYSNIESTLRDFLSTTFLKEIFIENSINVISLASQIRPITDESGDSINPFTVVAQALASQSGYASAYGQTSSPPNYNVNSMHKQELQQKIKEKTAIIHKYTQIDPVLSKLKPYIEIITMGNLIDVPVIVGTKCFQVDTLTLLHILIAAISMKSTLLPGGLSNLKNIDNICEELGSLDKTKYWRLLNKLVREQPKPVTDFFINTLKLGNTIQKIKLRAQSVGRGIKNKIEPFAPTLMGHFTHIHESTASEYSSLKPKEDFNEDSTFFILRTIKQNLDQTKLFFKFCLDPALLKSQFGIDMTTEQGSRSNLMKEGGLVLKESKIASQNTIIGFNALLNNHGISTLNSAANTILPNPSPLDIDVLSFIKEYISENLIPKINEATNELYKSINNSLESLSVETLKVNMAEAKEFCKFKVSIRSGNEPQIFVSFTANDFANFTDFLSTTAQSSVTQSKNLEMLLENFVDTKSEFVMNKLKNIRSIIDIAVSGFFNAFVRQYNLQINQPTVPQISMIPGIVSNGRFVSPNEVINGIIPAYKKHIEENLYFYFLCSLQNSLCKFIGVTEIQFERASSEVTEFPNYTLVLPLEIVLALHAVIVTRGWDDLIHTNEGNEVRLKTSEELSKGNIISITDNYIKGIVKFISMRLNVPNLIVIDSKKGDVYYKLMYQNSINKTKINTLETFIKESINKPITQNSTYY